MGVLQGRLIYRGDVVGCLRRVGARGEGWGVDREG
jgi:hypothetical protein